MVERVEAPKEELDAPKTVLPPCPKPAPLLLTAPKVTPAPAPVTPPPKPPGTGGRM